MSVDREKVEVSNNNFLTIDYTEYLHEFTYSS